MILFPYISPPHKHYTTYVAEIQATHCCANFTLAATYSDTDYYIDRISYNFKEGNYNAYIKSPTSIDTEFTLSITMSGKLQWDSYEDVLSGFNTSRRIDQEYRELTNTLFNNPSHTLAISALVHWKSTLPI